MLAMFLCCKIADFPEIPIFTFYPMTSKENKTRRYFNARRNAFAYAIAGISEAWRNEAHLRIHAAATTLVIVSGLHFNITALEWVAVTICCGLVVILELINTAIEKLCDLVVHGQNPVVRYIKDISSASVMLACIVSVIVGAIVFVPYFMAE
jgi:diacylglycerol kinase